MERIELLIIVSTCTVVLMTCGFIAFYVYAYGLKIKLKKATEKMELSRNLEWLTVKELAAFATVENYAREVRDQHKQFLFTVMTAETLQINSTSLILDKLVRFCKENQIEYSLTTAKEENENNQN